MVMRSFTQTWDINTEKDCPTLLGIHTPIGGDAWRFLYPFFQAYKKFKYVGCDVTIVNAARLPVDPEQLGKIDGTNYVDPRDSLNPLMFIGCHGEALGDVLNSMYGGLTTAIFKDDGLDKEQLLSTLEDFYYTALGDSAWRKSPVQKTLRIRGLHPIIYQMATQHQIMPSNALDSGNYAENDSDYNATGLNTSGRTGVYSKTVNDTARPFVNTPSQMLDPSTGSNVNRMLGTLFTNKATRLGWLDTLQLVGNKSSASFFGKERVTQLPKIFMGILMLPPAYLCRQYLRIHITHKFKFSGYRTITTGGAFPDYDTTVSHGYANRITGNVPNEGSKSLNAPLEGGTGGSMTDATDYDAIEEVENDEFDSQ